MNPNGSVLMLVFAARVASGFCICPSQSPRDTFPHWGDTASVDTEVLVLYTGGWLDETYLVEAGSGSLVVVTVEEVVEDEATWRHLRPLVPLAPDTDYVLTTADRSEISTFHTDGTLVPEDPAAVVQTAKSRGDQRCGDSKYLWLTFEGDDAGWYETEIADNRDLEDSVLRTGFGPDVSIGDDGCVVSLADLPDPAFVRSRAVNAAGVPGPWSDVERVGFGLGGCSHGPSASWAAMLLLTPLGLRRRPGRGCASTASSEPS